MESSGVFGLQYWGDWQLPFREIFSNIRLSALFLDQNGKILYANPYLADMTGWSGEDLTGKDWFEIFIPPSIREELKQKFRKAFDRAEIPLHHENEILHRNGSRRIVAWDNTFLRNVHGDLIGAVSIGSDITNFTAARKVLHEKVGFLESLMNALPNPVFIKNINGVYTGCNAAFEKFTGLSRLEMMGQKLSLPGWEKFLQISGEMDEITLREKNEVRYEVTLEGFSGHPARDVMINQTPLFQKNGDVGGIVGVIEDITERKRMEAYISLSEEKFRTIYEKSPIGIEIFGTDGWLVDINEACMQIFGIRNKRDVEGYNLFDDPGFSEVNQKLVKNGISVRYEAEFSFDKAPYASDRKGELLLDVMVTPFSGTGGNTEGYLLQIQDVTENRRNEERLKYLSLHDPLTGLYNRNYFEQEMERLAKSRASCAAVMVCDLDGLKNVNDILGHGRGDELLRRAAEALRQVFRGSDMVARIGGDEFAVILPDCGGRDMESVAGRLLKTLEKMNLDIGQPPLMLSVGYALVCESPIDALSLFQEADRNMYRYKREHKNESKERMERYIRSVKNIPEEKE